MQLYYQEEARCNKFEQAIKARGEDSFISDKSSWILYVCKELHPLIFEEIMYFLFDCPRKWWYVKIWNRKIIVDPSDLNTLKELLIAQDLIVEDEKETKPTRFEVIDHRKTSNTIGRCFVAHDVNVELSYQDDWKTLKVFITEKK